MPSDDSDLCINELMEFAGLANQTGETTLVRGILESIRSRRPLQADTEFDELLRQISERQLHER